MNGNEQLHSFYPPRQPLRQLSCARYVSLTTPPERFVFAQMTAGLREFHKRLLNKKDGNNLYNTSENESVDQEVFTPTLGTLLANRYKITGIVGKGESAVLVKAEDTFYPLKREVAVKILDDSYSNLGPQEASCLLYLKKADLLKVANAVEILNVFTLGKHFCIVFELLQPRPLHKYFQMWPFNSKAEKMKLIRKIAFQLTHSLAALSSLNIIHADIKPENILFQKGGENKVKIIDFGNALYCIYDEISLYFDEFELQTILYRAPEVMFGLPFGLSIDMWSMGCVLAELFLGEPLFPGRTKAEILEKMQSLLGPLPLFPFQSGKYIRTFAHLVGRISAHCTVVENIRKKLGTNDYAFADFIARLLTYDPSKRLDPYQAARHPFLARECALGYLVPAGNTAYNVDQDYSYPAVMLTPSTYPYRPTIDERIKRLHLSGLDLLRVGTRATDPVGEHVKVFPFSHEESLSEVQHDLEYVGNNTSKVIARVSQSSIVSSEENIEVGSNEHSGIRISAELDGNRKKRSCMDLSANDTSANSARNESAVCSPGVCKQQRNVRDNETTFELTSFIERPCLALLYEENKRTSEDEKRNLIRGDRVVGVSRQVISTDKIFRPYVINKDTNVRCSAQRGGSNKVVTHKVLTETDKQRNVASPSIRGLRKRKNQVRHSETTIKSLSAPGISCGEPLLKDTDHTSKNAKVHVSKSENHASDVSHQTAFRDASSRRHQKRTGKARLNYVTSRDRKKSSRSFVIEGLSCNAGLKSKNTFKNMEENISKRTVETTFKGVAGEVDSTSKGECSGLNQVAKDFSSVKLPKENAEHDFPFGKDNMTDNVLEFAGGIDDEDSFVGDDYDVLLL